MRSCVGLVALIVTTASLFACGSSPVTPPDPALTGTEIPGPETTQLLAALHRKGATGAAPACQNVVENRFVVSHEAGSAECRGQIICATPPPPECDAGQHKCDGQCVSNSSS